MRYFTKKLLLLLLIFVLLLSGCSGSSKRSNIGHKETGGNSWISANAQPRELLAATPRTTTEDWRDEIIYFLMTDRFCDGDSSNNGSFYNKNNVNYYHGGDLQGIMDQVDYLRHLGITSIWITPPVENVWRDPHYSEYTGYHGYWARDFSKLDPHLGSDTEFYRSFINTMHQNGLLVIQDIVVNHLGPLAAYNSGWTPTFSTSGYARTFAQTLNSTNAKTYNYTIPTQAPFNQLTSFNNYGQINNYDDPTQLVKGDLSDLPDLNTENMAVKAELINAYSKWAGLGVNGFRIDTVRHVESAFWDDFCPQIRNAATDNNFLQFGEVWIGHHPTLANYVNSSSGLDSVLNYDLYYVMRTVFGNVADAYHTNATNELTQELARRNSYNKASAQNLLVNFIDNHDNNRFLTDANQSLDRMWLALTYLMTTKGIPCIYYNTENNILGDTNTGRKDLANFQTTNKRTFALIQALTKIRQENSALRRGELEVLKDSSSAGIFAFVRSTGNQDENVFVLLNTSGATITETVCLKEYAFEGAILTNILYSEFGHTDSLTVTNDNINVTIPAYSMKIYKK